MLHGVKMSAVEWMCTP